MKLRTTLFILVALVVLSVGTVTFANATGDAPWGNMIQACEQLMGDGDWHGEMHQSLTPEQIDDMVRACHGGGNSNSAPTTKGL